MSSILFYSYRKDKRTKPGDLLTNYALSNGQQSVSHFCHDFPFSSTITLFSLASLVYMLQGICETNIHQNCFLFLVSSHLFPCYSKVQHCNVIHFKLHIRQSSISIIFHLPLSH
jgi:hypothetical protein